jgi:hypothetical protein
MKFDPLFSRFFDQVRRIRLSESVRDAVRERLSAYADLHAVREAITPSRFAALDGLRLRFFQAAFVIFILAASTGGVAYASGAALPGDILYPVKVGFVEPLESAILTDTRSRATWNAILAERRLAEAASLAISDTLTEESRSYLEERFAYHAALSSGAAEEFMSAGNTDVALAVRSDLEARLTAHSDLFEYLATEEGGEVQRLHSAITRTRDSVAADRQRDEERVSERGLAYDDRQIALAESVTESLAQSLAHAGVADGAIESRLNAAREAFMNARSSLARDEDGIAYVATQAASRLTHEASILAKNRSILARGLPERPAAADVAPAADAPQAPARAKSAVPAIMLLKLPDVDTSRAATTSDAKDSEDKEDEDIKDSDKSSDDEDSSSDSQRGDDEDGSSSDSDSDRSDSSSDSSSSVRDTVRGAVRSLLGD